MSCVKPSSAGFRRAVLALSLPGFAALQGCADTQLMRFAPPGIIKYEEIAGDQPVNPQVAERIAERRAETGGAKFPNLAQAPDEGDRPAMRPTAELQAEKDALAGARDDLADDIAGDRTVAEEELADDLAGARDALESDIERDNVEAAAERRKKLVAPPAENALPEEDK